MKKFLFLLIISLLYSNTGLAAQQITKILTGTNSLSVNPSLAVNKSGTTTYRLTWEQIQDAEYSSIKYAVLSGGQISGGVTTISTNSGSRLNFSPTISVANNSPIVSWTGARNPGDGIDKRKAITTRGTNWGSFQVTGTDVNFVNNNSELGSNERTVIIWSEGASNPTTKWIRRDGSYYSVPRLLSNSGIQSQISSGTDFKTISAIVFKEKTPHIVVIQIISLNLQPISVSWKNRAVN